MQTSELKRIAVIFISFCFPQFSAIHLKFQESVLTELVRWLEDVDFNVLLHFQEHLSPWWASLVKKKKEASETWTSRLTVRMFADKSKGETLYPLIKDGTTKTAKKRTSDKFKATAVNGSGRFLIARHRWEPLSLRCVTRMLRNSTAQKLEQNKVIFLLFCFTFSSCFHQGAKKQGAACG